ncbi:FAD:protein FMN transferase [Candidatus Gracilibacteria bacterium]|nr:FAD:protein FMN transferase [Candidatus Gracilibacteria bacterium]
MLYSRSEKHLGTTFEIQIVSEKAYTEEVLTELFLFCEDFEAEFSRFREDSSLSILNKEKQLSVSLRFIDLLTRSLELEKETDGVFSVTANVGRLGYTKDFESGKFEPIQDIYGTLPCIITIENTLVTLSESTSLDFGGIGKGYLIDQLGEKLRTSGYDDFCINGGGDILLSGKNPEGEKWVIGVEDPLSGVLCSTIELTDMSIATSGSYKRQWTIDSEKYHHIIDAHTGKNNHELLSVTLISKDTTRTDALTKAIWHTPFLDMENAFKKYDLEGIVIEKGGKIFVSPKCVTKYGFRMSQ